MDASSVKADHALLGSIAQRVQGHADDQAADMQHLGSTLESLGAGLQGQAGKTMQAVGHDIKQQGMANSTRFAGQSHATNSSNAIFANADQDGQHIIGQVAGLT